MDKGIIVAIKRIRAYAKANNITKSRLALDAGLSDRALKDFWTEAWNPTLESLRKIEGLIPPSFK